MSFAAPDPAEDLRRRIRDLDSSQVAPARAKVDEALVVTSTEITAYRHAIEDSRSFKLPPRPRPTRPPKA